MTTPEVRHPFRVLAVVLTATFMQLVDVSIVNVAIPSIQRDLDATYANIQLVLAGYTLAFACTLITSARLGDLYGRRRMFLIGMVGFTIASALCGAAPTATVLVVARIWQGLMSGLMFPQVLSVVQVIFPPRQRAKAFAVYGASIGLATILGPVLGGILIDADIFGSQWRSIFYVNVPVGVVAFLLALRMLPESRSEHATRLDLPGAVLVTAGLFLLVYPLTEGREKGWPAWIWVMLACSLPLLAAFVVYDLRKTRRDDSPLVDMRLFDAHSFRAGLPLATLFFSGVPPFFFLFSLYIQIGEGFSPLKAGLTSLPFALASAFASSRSAGVVKRLGRNTLLVAIGLLLVGVALVALTVTVEGADPSPYAFIPAFVVSGLGLGLFIAPNTNIILSEVPQRSAGPASGVLSTGQQVGGSIGIALCGVVFFGLLGWHAAGSADRVEPDLRASLAAAGLPPSAVEAAVSGFRTCFVERSKAADPTALPPSCRRLESGGASGSSSASAGTAQVTSAVLAAADEGRRDNFSVVFRWTLLYEALVWSLAFLLVLRLPEVDLHPEEMAPAAEG